MSIEVIVGEQRGDEGKGRFTDMLAAHADIVGRGQGGPNAGHTVLTDDGRELALHSVPSGIAYEHTMNIIGRGCLIDAVKLDREIDDIQAKGFEVSPQNLMINSGAHLILPHHVSEDEIREAGDGRQGSTKSGISPTAGAKYGRKTSEAIRAEDINNNLLKIGTAISFNLKKQQKARDDAELPEIDIQAVAEEYIDKVLKLSAFITDTEVYLHRQIEKGARVVAEGAQAFWLDPDHGMWPAVTSTSTTAGGVLNGLGIPPKYVSNVVGVSKLIQSHVGGGPFVTEIEDIGLLDQLHGQMGLVDSEEGTTTGRKRRLGYLDLPAIRRAQWVNGTNEMAVTKLDWVPRFGGTVKICTSYTRKGKELRVAPDAAYKLEQSEANYVELPTWSEDIQGVRKFEDLPQAARNYITFIESEMNAPITMIGVGPARDQVIDRRQELGLA